MTYFERPTELKPEQRTTLEQGFRTSFERGIVQRYQGALARRLAFHENVLESTPDSTADIKFAEEVRAASMAEVICAFSLEPSNMAVSVHMVKVNPVTGEKMDYSDVQIGLVGGLAGNGSPNKKDGFSPDDLSFAVDRIRTQESVGLPYGIGISGATGFIAE